MKPIAKRGTHRAPTSSGRSGVGGAGAVVLAALALPGVWSGSAQAQGRPEKGSFAFKYLYYQDSQPGFKRVTVNSPSIYVFAPVGKDYAVEGALVVDALSGATPRWQTAVSSASKMSEERGAGDIKVTRYFDRSSYSAGMSYSKEHDFLSIAISLGASWSSPDNNTTWDIGVAGTADRIEPTGGGIAGVTSEKRDSTDMIIGVTQALTRSDLLQVNATFSTGEGYYSDPYKTLDERPGRRKLAALLARWNHYLEGDGSSLRSSYRLYRDSFGIHAHTFQGEWARPVTQRLTLTPLLRYYSQSAARFYAEAQYDPATGLPIYPAVAPGQLNSGDQRLSAFGAVTLGVKADYKLTTDWSLDGKLESYQQRSAWHLGGNGSRGLEPLRAIIVQVGARFRF